MAFCICATDAHGVSDWPSPLLSLVEWMWPVKWASVLLAIFLLVLVAQLYLCCCTRPDDRDGSPQPGRRMPDDEGPRGGGRKKCASAAAAAGRGGGAVGRLRPKCVVCGATCAYKPKRYSNP